MFRVAILIAASMVLSGCHFHGTPISLGPVDATAAARPRLDGRTGAAMSWPELHHRIARAQVIIIGEEHDDAAGHAVELALVMEALTHPRPALSMEMLERDDQNLTDDYLEGIIDAAAFAKLTNSTNWGGEGMWDDWYQPMIDAAKKAGAPVIAANAPRRYVRLAKNGYDALDELSEPRRDLVAKPQAANDAAYRKRFFDLMTPKEEPKPEDASAHSGMSAEQIEGMYRSQLVWDATMADSISRGLERSKKIVHIVGQFHSDFEGGLVKQLRVRRPGVRMLTISLQPADPVDGALREEDRDRADIVIYTGPKPEKPEDEAPAAGT